jgi:uncharacterized cupin superfamily protein
LSPAIVRRIGGETQRGDGPARVGRNDPARHATYEHVHGGPGALRLMELLDPACFRGNVIFLHRGLVLGRSGIGHHSHSRMEEMFVLLEGEAELTVDGHTARLMAPVTVPCPLGHSHALLNRGDAPLEWMNVAVGAGTRTYDCEDLGDDRTDAVVEPVPAFAHGLLDPGLLAASAAGASRRRRLFDRSTFRGDWDYVDHALVEAGTAVSAATPAAGEELCYVLAGAGRLDCAAGEHGLRAGDAFALGAGEEHELRAAPAAALELLAVGIRLPAS